MNREFSIYLDAVRFLAAVLVVVFHSNHRLLVEDILPFSSYGHSAVIVFFVLSGFVIAYITETKESSARRYFVSRIGRIYSVALAAIVLSLVLDVIGEKYDPRYYIDKTTYDFWYVRVVSSLFFLSEIWIFSIQLFSNVPYWSLNYEVWYYILFAALTFLSGKRRLLVFFAIVLLLGPKILLLAPIWWAGVWLYRSSVKNTLSEPGGWVLFLGSLALLAAFHHFQVRELLGGVLREFIGASVFNELSFSRFFLSDYLLAPIIVMNFAGFRVISHRFKSGLIFAETPIRFLAGFTFSLYLFHQPLILVFAALIGGDPQGYMYYFQVMAAVIFSVFVLGTFTEKNKLFFRGLAERLIDLFLWLLAILRGTVGALRGEK